MPPNDPDESDATRAGGSASDDAREARRIQELRDYDILDSAPEASFDDLVRAAAAIAGTSSAAVSLMDVDRQWHKAFINMKTDQTPRNMAFCDHVVRTELAMVIEDTYENPEFSTHPAVLDDPDLRFYAGFPLRAPSGLVLGTLCVVDAQPRRLTDVQRMVLQTLAGQVMARLDLRRELAARERTLARLSASENRYRSLVEDSTDVIARHRPDGSVIYVSPAIRRLLGVAPESPQDWDLNARTHPEDVEALTEAWFAVLSGQERTVAGRIRHADGDYRFLELSLRPIQDGAGAVTEVLVTTRDATARLQAAQDLAAANAEITRHKERLEAAEHLSGVGSWSMEAATSTFTWSPELHRIYGFPPGADITGARFREGLDPADEPLIDAALARTVATGEPVPIETRIVRHDGERRTLRGQLKAHHDPDGQLVSISGISRDVTDERQTRQALEAAHDLLDQVMNATSRTAVITLHPDGSVNAWNRGAERLLGYTLREARAGGGLLDWHDRDEFADRARRYGLSPADGPRVVTRGGELGENEWTLIRRDGRRILVSLEVSELHGPDGGLSGWLGFLHDVTEARRAQRQAQEASERFHQLLRAGTDQAIIGADTEGLITLFNRGAERMTGWRAEEMIGRRSWVALADPRFEAQGRGWHGLGDDEIVARLEAMTVEEFFAAGALADDPDGTDTGTDTDTGTPDREPARHRDRLWRRKDGSRLTVQLSASRLRDPDGRHTGFVSIATDVTERVRAERERDEHATMMRAVIENNQSIIFVKDLEGRYLLVNRAYEETHDVTEAELLGRTDELRYPAMAAQWHAANLRAVDGAYAMEEYADLPDGRHVYDAVKVPLYDGDGAVYAICGISLDVTERRKAERVLRDALELAGHTRDEALAADAAKSAFLATMSHEIRTPMNAVIGMTGLVLDTELDAEQRDLMETVRSSGDQLLAIINDILDFSKIEAGDLDLEFRPFDLHDLVEGTMAQFAGSSHGLDLVSHVDPACPGSVIGDVIRLRQVLANLVGNAVKFTAEGDVLVRVTIDGTGEGPGSGDERIRLRFEVRDTGIGVPPESLDRLFRSFSQVDASTTRTFGGTGLGLAISKALVTAMGGDIWVDSTPGAGSTFSFTVLVGHDRDGRGLADSHPGQAALRARLGGRRALVVDDNATNRRVLRLQLRSFDMTCVDLATPAEALELLADPAQQFDLAILDLMPQMDGAQLAARIRALPGRDRLPLVLQSGVGTRVREHERDFDVVLTKPVRSGQLIESVAKAISPAPRLPVQAVASPAETTEVQRLRILIAEDNEVNQRVGRLMLTRLGHAVQIAVNGVEALNAVHANDYDVVLMDMHMPVMDGLVATRRIRAEIAADRQPMIVAMTASVTLEDREACAAAGMDGYLSKPVRAGDLTAVLSDLSGTVR